MSFEQLVRICGGAAPIDFEKGASFRGVSIDSRSIERGELFVAIRGESNDGHDFIAAALKGGAAGLLVEQKWFDSYHSSPGAPVIVVNDSHTAMLELARHYLAEVAPRVGAITGSNGKTTTKEYAVALLKEVEPDYYGSPGNLNNLYGLPLAIFKMSRKTKAAVFELGISTPEEMPILAGVARPDVVCITNVGPSHLQELIGVEQVARAKLQLATHAGDNRLLIVNADDEVLMREAARVKNQIMTFSLTGDADYKTDFVRQADDSQAVSIEGNVFHLALPGRHQAANLLAAYALIRSLGYSFDGVDTEQIQFSTAPMRGQIERIGSLKVMSDCYNANPQSMRAGLEAFCELKTVARRVVVVGDMLELGTGAEEYHRRVGEQIAASSIDLAVFVGALSRTAADAAIKGGMTESRVVYFENAEAARIVVKEFEVNDFIYLKASRGTRLELVLDEIRKSFGRGGKG